ncbi:MAG TPA: hypothetical protein VKH15_02865 [Candidatus Acidoferrum sp.]|jgi:hypothetical protein|nr:hypothetical protein [Candidatus Acidoferrum sp.]
MKALNKIAGLGFAAAMLAGICSGPVRAQSPATVVPVVVDTAVPIIVNTVNAIKPKPQPGVAKFEGYVMHANIAQITVRAKGNDMSLQTFPLSQQVSTKMQTIVDKGGYQYGDKVTIYYDQTNLKALRIKGKPSKAI